MENAGAEMSARKNDEMQRIKMQEWKFRHDPKGVENTGVEISGVNDGAEHAFFVFYTHVTVSTCYNQNSSIRMS